MSDTSHLTGVLTELVQWDRHRRKLEEDLAKIKEKLGKLQEQALDGMQKVGMSQTKMDGTTVFIRRELWGGAKDGKMMELIHRLTAVRDTRFLVQEKYNAQQLSSWVRELPKDDQGMPAVPPHLKGCLKVTERFSVRTRKS